MTRSGRTARGARRARAARTWRGALRLLVSALLLAGFALAQSASHTHGHIDAGHDSGCAVCRVAADAAHALDAPAQHVAWTTTPVHAPVEAEPGFASAAQPLTCGPRAPPIA